MCVISSSAIHHTHNEWHDASVDVMPCFHLSNCRTSQHIHFRWRKHANKLCKWIWYYKYKHLQLFILWHDHCCNIDIDIDMRRKTFIVSHYCHRDCCCDVSPMDLLSQVSLFYCYYYCYCYWKREDHNFLYQQLWILKAANHQSILLHSNRTQQFFHPQRVHGSIEISSLESLSAQEMWWTEF